MNSFGRYEALTTTHDLVYAYILFIRGERIDRNEESLMMILLSESIASLNPSYSEGFTTLL